jgi:hypothetical protein
MKFKFWSHRNGFRSPTEQQLVGWEFDGGNQKECDDAVLFEGRLYNCRAELLKARIEHGIKKAAVFLQHSLENRLESRSTTPDTGPQL